VQIFLTFLISFILRVLESNNGEFDLYEPFDDTFYGWLLIGSMGAVIATGIVLTAWQWYRLHRFRGRVGNAARDVFANDDFALVGSGNLRDNAPHSLELQEDAGGEPAPIE
jgi:hypothetical protein